MTNLSQPNNQDALLNATPNATHSYDAADMADQLKVMPTLEARLTTILNEINALRLHTCHGQYGHIGQHQ